MVTIKLHQIHKVDQKSKHQVTVMTAFKRHYNQPILHTHFAIK